MIYEIVVEGFVLDVEVTRCIDQPPQPNSRDSDWDFYGTRELDFAVRSGITYDDDGVRMDCDRAELEQAGDEHEAAITAELWRQIDAEPRRSRWAA